MKKFILTLVGVLAIVACSTTPSKKVEEPVNPNTDIRKVELDQIRVGDKLIKVTAILGKPTEKKITPQGTEMIWWLTDAGYDDGYKTLARKPADTMDMKFIKLMFDTKDTLVSKDFLL